MNSNNGTRRAMPSRTLTSALAATLATDPPAKRTGHARVPRLLAAALLIVVLGVGYAVVHATRSPSTPAVSPAAAGPATPEWRAPSVELAPLAPPIACASAASAVEPPRPATSVPSAHPSARSSASAAVPPPGPPSTSRVDQKGLAGENPFR